MKKTFITVLLFSSLLAHAGETPSAVWSVSNLNMSGHAYYNINTAAAITTTTGMTACITVDWAALSNAPLLWFCTDAGTGYNKSAATLGYQGAARHAILLDLNGSSTSTTNNYNNNESAVETPDAIPSSVYLTGTSVTPVDFKQSITYFVTAQDGVSKLYTLMGNGDIQQIATRSGLATGTIDKLYVGHWNEEDSHMRGNIKNIALYGTVLTTEQMHAIATPEATTATLSLLALLGLCARRKRK